MSAYDCVLFDLDNTFYAYDPCHRAGLDGALALAGEDGAVEPGELREAYARAREAVHARLKNTAASHSRLLYFHGALEELLGASRPELALKLNRAYWDSYFDRMAANLDPAAGPLLEALRAQGVKTALVTDLTTRVQFDKLRRLGLEARFDRVVTSEEAGAEKPDPAMLRLAVEKLGLEKARIAMVGDSPKKDGGAAAAAGADFYWLRRDPGLEWPGELAEPAGQVSSLAELSQLLGVSLGA